MSQAVHPTDGEFPTVSVNGAQLSAAWQLPDQPETTAAEIDDAPGPLPMSLSMARQSIETGGGDSRAIDSVGMSTENDLQKITTTKSVKMHHVGTVRTTARHSVHRKSVGMAQHLSLAHDTNPMAEELERTRSEVQQAFKPHQSLSKPLHRVRMIRKCVESKAYGAVSMVALGLALFGGALFALCNVPDDPGTALLDTIMCMVTIFFLVEIVVLSVAGNGYPLSFFFWMDILGTISMVFEISFLLGRAGKMRVEDTDVNPVLLRSARAAKVGARAARLSKVFKCFTFSTRRNSLVGLVVTGKEEGSTKAVQAPEYDAQILKQRLNLSLSSKVSMLTVVLVIATPMFNISRYPEEDFSMKGWVTTLELDYSRAWISLDTSSVSSTNFFSVTVNAMTDFYSDINYSPYKLDGYDEQVVVNSRTATILGTSLVTGDEPKRKQNIVQQKVKTCLVQRPGCIGGTRSAIYFDFSLPNTYEAMLDIGVIIFIILCMVIEAWDLSRSVDAMVVRPVEKMLGTVQMMAQILSAVRPDAGSGGDEGSGVNGDVDPFDEESMSEAQMLEVVFGKFSVLIKKFMNVAEDESLDMATDDESKGLMLELMGLNEVNETSLASAINSVPAGGKVVTTLPVDEETLDSWHLNIWAMKVEDQTTCVRYYMFDHEDSVGKIWTDVNVFFRFQELVRIQYVEANPYHNYIHACDVVASVFRVFRRLRCREWLSDIDIYAMLVSALCHDVAHPGKTTPFLVETRNELAVRYNDASPLENMHCATMFQVCMQEGADIFQKFERDAYKQARKVCVNSILHTDNAQHFEMVKAVKDAYEICSDICDAQADDLEWFTEMYISEVLYKGTPLWHQLILHLCDVSNPLKPWAISRLLATRVQDEFFNQGDEEKRLGLPIGMLNDRDKVIRSGAEHGFINFLVSPLVLATVGNFPYLHHLATEMVTNMKEWRNVWVQDAKPSAEETAKRDGDIKKVAEQVDKLTKRKPISTIRNELYNDDGTKSTGTKGPSYGSQRGR